MLKQVAKKVLSTVVAAVLVVGAVQWSGGTKTSVSADPVYPQIILAPGSNAPGADPNVLLNKDRTDSYYAETDIYTNYVIDFGEPVKIEAVEIALAEGEIPPVNGGGDIKIGHIVYGGEDPYDLEVHPDFGSGGWKDFKNSYINPGVEYSGYGFKTFTSRYLGIQIVDATWSGNLLPPLGYINVRLGDSSKETTINILEERTNQGFGDSYDLGVKTFGEIVLDNTWGCIGDHIMPNPGIYNGNNPPMATSTFMLDEDYLLKKIDFIANHKADFTISSSNNSHVFQLDNAFGRFSLYTSDLWDEPAGTVSFTVKNVVSDISQSGIAGFVYMPLEGDVSYTVSFDSNGGSSVEQKEIFEGRAVPRPEDPEFEGYIFSGWFTQNDVEWDFINNKVYSDTVLYAKWTEDLTVVVTVPELVTAVQLSSHGSPRVPVGATYKGLEFTSPWCTNGGVYSTIIYPDHHEGHPVGKFVVPRGHLLNEIYINFGHAFDAVISSSNPLNADVTRNNCIGADLKFEFGGWVEPIGEVSLTFNTSTGSDRGQIGLTKIVFSALSTVRHTVSFESNGGSFVEPIEVREGTVVSKPLDPAPPVENAIFYGWYENSDFIGESFNFHDEVITESVTLYAYWCYEFKVNIAQEYNKNSNGNFTGGDHMVRTTVSGVTFTEGLAAGGWSGQSSKIYHMPTSYNKTGVGFGYATFTVPEGYTLKTLRLNSGRVCDVTIKSSNSLNDDLVYKDIIAGNSRLNVDNSIDLGYDWEWVRDFGRFSGANWKAPAGTVTIELSNIRNGGNVDHEVTQFGITEFVFRSVSGEFAEVSFESYGGTAIAPIAITKGGSILNPPVEPTRSGYVFGGWYDNSALNGAPYNLNTAVFNVNTKLYAYWEKELIINIEEMFTDVAYQNLLGNGNRLAEAEYLGVGFPNEHWIAGNNMNFVYPNIYEFGTYSHVEGILNIPAGYTLKSIDFRSAHTVDVKISSDDEGNAVYDFVTPANSGVNAINWEKGISTLYITLDNTMHAWPNELSQFALYGLTLVPVRFDVDFNSNGGSPVLPQSIMNNEKVFEPVDPYKEGFEFGGWFKEAGCINMWNFAIDVVSGDTTLYAKWLGGNSEDINVDGQVDAGDLAILLDNYGKVGVGIDNALADIDKDGQVDSGDLSLLLEAYGK